MLKYIKHHDAASGQNQTIKLSSVWTADKAEQFSYSSSRGSQWPEHIKRVPIHLSFCIIYHLFTLHPKRCDNQLCPHQWILMTGLSSHIVPSGSLWPLSLNFVVCDQIHNSYSIFFSTLCCVLLQRLNLCFLIVLAGLRLGGSICSLK